MLIRFEYVTDDAVYRDGLMVADISIPQLDSAADTDAWAAKGFTLARESLPQRFIVQIITTNANGEYHVSRLDLDADNSAPNHPDRPGHARRRGDHRRLPHHPPHPPQRNLHPGIQTIELSPFPLDGQAKIPSPLTGGKVRMGVARFTQRR